MNFIETNSVLFIFIKNTQIYCSWLLIL